MSSTGASAAARLPCIAQALTVKKATENETTMDLEKIIDDLVYRKKKLDLDRCGCSNAIDRIPALIVGRGSGARLYLLIFTLAT